MKINCMIHVFHDYYMNGYHDDTKFIVYHQRQKSGQLEGRYSVQGLQVDTGAISKGSLVVMYMQYPKGPKLIQTQYPRATSCRYGQI